VTDTIHGAGKLDPANLHTGSQLRALGGAELARLGEESLKDHLVNTAILAHQEHSPLSGERLLELLENRNLVRHPVKLVFENGSMAPHQFAHPELDGESFKLYVHPQLKHNAEMLAQAVAYFIPVMNYGSLINDDHCLIYGATLLGMTIDDYYRALCNLADSVGAPARDRSANGDRF
jgi:hypothetical protein